MKEGRRARDPFHNSLYFVLPSFSEGFIVYIPLSPCIFPTPQSATELRPFYMFEATATGTNPSCDRCSWQLPGPLCRYGRCDAINTVQGDPKSIISHVVECMVLASGTKNNWATLRLLTYIFPWNMFTNK